jgi:DNA-directed RNA polymerase specialized sigma24 family protein
VNRDTAIDVAQGAWLRGWERLDQLRDESVLVTWVNTIALNQFRKTVRRDQRHEALRDVPYPKPALNWAAIDLSRILSRCRSRDRVLLKAQLEGVTVKELSERSGASAIAMRLRLYRARHAARMIAQGLG